MKCRTIRAPENACHFWEKGANKRMVKLLTKAKVEMKCTHNRAPKNTCYYWEKGANKRMVKLLTKGKSRNEVQNYQGSRKCLSFLGKAKKQTNGKTFDDNQKSK